jgi:hypothetical protein
MLCRGRFGSRLALRPRTGSTYTQSADYQKRQSCVDTSVRSPHNQDENKKGRPESLPEIYCCWLSAAGTTPDRYTVRVRSLSCFRSTLNTTFCPGFSLATALR